MLTSTYFKVEISDLTPGDTLRIDIPVAGFVPVAGDMALAHVRATAESPAIVIGFGTAPTNQAGTITLAVGVITLSAPSAATLNVPPGAYVWDLELTRAGEVDTIMDGKMTWRRDITRAPAAPVIAPGALDFTLPGNSQNLTII